MHPIQVRRRNQLIILALATPAAMALILFLLVFPLRSSLAAKGDQVSEARTRVANARRTVQLTDAIRAELNAKQAELDAVELGIAHGDVYRWIVNALLGFEGRFNIEFNNIEQPTIADLTVPPKLPYRGATLNVSGVGTYHDVGRFLLALEQKYTLIRLQGLSLDPASYVETDPELPGRLNFRVALLILVKPSAATQ